MDGIRWQDIAMWGPTALMFGMGLWFILRIAPTWKEVRLRELDIRATESEVTKQQAAALGQLGGGLNQMADTLKDIAVEQRRATETIKILQRVNADSSDEIARSVAILTDRVDRLEKRYDEPQRNQPADN